MNKNSKFLIAIILLLTISFTSVSIIKSSDSNNTTAVSPLSPIFGTTTSTDHGINILFNTTQLCNNPPCLGGW